MAAETQDYLDEAKTPSVIGRAQIQAAMKAFANALGEGNEQATKWARLLQAAEMAETDPEVAGKFEEIFQKLRAMKRISDELERHTRDLALCHREFASLDSDLRVIAEEKGFTT